MTMNYTNTIAKQNILSIRQYAKPVRTGALGLFCAFALAACGSSGSGSSGNNVTPPSGTAPQALNFSYPYDGQTNVTPGALIRLKFDQGAASDSAGSLTLVSENGDQVTVNPQVSDNNSLVSLRTDAPLSPDTVYTVRTGGDDLFSFTTAPNKTTPSADGFEVTQATPDGTSVPFMAFSTLRLRFSEPVNPNTVVQGDGFSFTDSKGNEVPGNLYVQGRELVFDPRLPYDPSRSTAECDREDPQKPNSALACDLDPSETYSFTLDAGTVKSVFGNPLQANGESSFSVTPRAVGGATVTSLAVATPQSGGDGNTVEVKSQLLGDNTLTIDPNSADLYTVVSQQLVNAPALGGSVLPLVLRRSGGFSVSPLDVKFSGKIPAGISSGKLHNVFITDLSAYFTGSPFDNNGAVGIRMNFDVAVYGADEKGNGAFNQNVLNVTAVGTASADGQGNLSIDSLGSFPVSVNGVDKATTNFRLRLEAPASVSTGDTTPPTIVAQQPSACAYGYNLSFKLTPVYVERGGDQNGNIPVLDANGDAVPASAPPPPAPPSGLRILPLLKKLPDLDTPVDATEADCADYLQASGNGGYLTVFSPAGVGTGDVPPQVSLQPGVNGINDVLPENNLSITFSEPVDPASLTDINGNPSAGTLQLAGPAGNIPFTLRVEGSSVVIDPVDPLDYNTAYTLTVGTGITDLAGNPLAAGQLTAFNTAPFVPANDGQKEAGFFGPPHDVANNIIQTSPFLTTLYPGLPCTLEPTSGDFRSGGDMAGYCVGNDTTSSAPQRAWGVFDLPANRSIHAVFSKPMRTDSITLADGCLTATDGSAAMASNDGAIAVQTMDDSGQCTGTVAGDIVVPHPGDSTTRKANFHPAKPWQDGQRYWLVICGSNDPGATCTGGQTLRDVDDGKTDGSAVTQRETDNGFTTHDGRLNTDPMNGTGTNVGLPPNVGFYTGYGFFPAAGGPDLVMPFDGAPATQDQLLISDLAPFTDVNGNGFADGAAGLNVFIDDNNNGVKDPGEEFRTGEIAAVLPPEKRERPQPSNRVFARVPVINGNIAGRGQEVLIYNSGAQPASVGAVRSAADCQAMMSQAVRDMVGSNPGRCAPVTVYPGGLVAQTAGNSTNLANFTAYGRTLLHTAGVPEPDDPQRTVPQTGYIVDRCQGSHEINALVAARASASPDEVSFVQGDTQTYDYSPCFVLEQKLIFTADPFAASPQLFPPLPSTVRDEHAPQQGLTVNLVGPVSFQRNGRLVIRATNTNNIILRETRNPQFSSLTAAIAPIAIPAGNTTLQLVGPAIHGGPLEAFKSQ